MPAGAVLLLVTNLLPAGAPFYAKADLTYDPGLIATYYYPKTKESVSVAKGGMAAYRVALSDRKGTTLFDARLFNLYVQGRERPLRFLDLAPVPAPPRPSYGFPAAAAHLAVRAEWDGDELRLSTVDRAWLDRALKEEDMPRLEPALGQDTEGLQKILAWAETEGKYKKPLVFQRR